MSRDIRSWLDGHINLEAGSVGIAPGRDRANAPTLERIQLLSQMLGSPEADLDVVHITGTNGKTSVTRMVTSLLLAAGHSVGSYSSPHLERVNERISLNGHPISDQELNEVLAAVRLAEEYAFGDSGTLPSYFELLTAAGFRYFSDEAVEAVVLEVGMGGSWDATNIAAADVAVITNVELDHVAFLGRTREEIAREKSGIVTPGCPLILGETDAALFPIFESAGANELHLARRDFGVAEAMLAHGGRLISLRNRGRVVQEVLLPLHGAHQSTNAAIALAATEAFLGETLDDEVVREGFAQVTSPGRLEVMGRGPLFLLDGAHNVAGMQALRASLNEEFGAGSRTFIIGLLVEKSAEEMLSALELDDAETVICVAPPSPRAMDPAVVAAAAQALGGADLRVMPANDISEAVRLARTHTEDAGQIIACGSLYLVGAVRGLLNKSHRMDRTSRQ